MPIPSSAAPAPQGADPARAFLSQIGIHLGIPPQTLAAVEAGEPFMGPSGLLCRIHTRAAEAGWHAYPEVVLPMAAAELGGLDVLRLLGVQEQLLGEEGWHLGLMEGGGLLSLRPLQASADAAQVAADMDRGHVLGRAALDVLAGDPSPADAGPGGAP
ncbi:DUF4037 domain-containing protein [Acidovorax sp. GBBC 3334]|uniref:Hpa3 family type III secretion system protein n=1 Tax=unclassified Acidovorax TaxID=2684926 RepID=UPI002304656B|nr:MULTISPECIES: Hpa3 family type III secretion system protein [unclassified Acidovorax]MDA8455986.1 DUF4037 domain-containing protein [Acidovorax sp. GBBC 3334]MDA8523697.1 DUF4037 domain-containing protein [Acidovorax sp. NCPPB 4044]